GANVAAAPKRLKDLYDWARTWSPTITPCEVCQHSGRHCEAQAQRDSRGLRQNCANAVFGRSAWLAGAALELEWKLLEGRRFAVGRRSAWYKPWGRWRPTSGTQGRTRRGRTS